MEMFRQGVVRQLKSRLGKWLPVSAKKEIRKQWKRMKRLARGPARHGLSHAQVPLDPTDPISVEFHKRGPWFTQFVLNGKLYGGGNSYEGDLRVQDYFKWVQPHGKVLELGSFEAGHTLMLAAYPTVQSVLGLEGRDYLIEKSNFVKEVFQCSNIRFLRCDLETESLTQFGKFDSVFCSGVLYHLTRPWKLVANIGAVTDHLFLSTHYSLTEECEREGYFGKTSPEFGYDEPLSGLSDHSFWLSLESIKKALDAAGFETVEVHIIPPAIIGAIVNIYARKGV